MYMTIQYVKKEAADRLGRPPSDSTITTWRKDGIHGVVLKSVKDANGCGWLFKRQWVKDFLDRVLVYRQGFTPGRFKSDRKHIKTETLVRRTALNLNQDGDNRWEAFKLQFELHNGRPFDPAIDDPQQKGE